MKGLLGRQKADLDIEETWEGGCPSHHLWLRAWERPRGLLLLSLAWLMTGQAVGGAEPWGLPWERLSLPTGPPGLYCRRAQDFQVLLWMASHRGIGEVGQGGAYRGGGTGHRGPLARAVIVGPATPAGSKGSAIALSLQQLRGYLVHKIVVALYNMPETTKSYILNVNSPGGSIPQVFSLHKINSSSSV